MSEGSELETKFWYKVLKAILYALLLTPIWFWSIFLFPFITTKVIYLRSLVSVAFVIYFMLALSYPQIRPKWNWLMKSVWIYILVMIVASIFGVNVYKSFFGTVERGEGIFTMIHYALYFTMLASILRTGKDWYRYLMSAAGVVGYIAVYGLLQSTGAAFVIGGQGSRISGTIGNAAFFAAVMLFGIFLSVFLLYHPRTSSGGPKKKVYLWTVLAVTLVATYASQTRGALIALILAVLVYIVFLMLKSRTRRIKLVAGIVLVALVLGGIGIYLGRDSKFVQSQDTLRRLATISPTDITTQSRFDTWSASWAGWKDRFIFGYGYENNNIVFNKYFPARIFKDQGSQIWFDRAHNIILDVGTTSGIVGLIAYLSIFVSAVWYLLKLYKKSREPDQEGGMRWELPLLLILVLMAYFVQNMFVFDTHATYLMIFLVLAYISHLINSNFPKMNFFLQRS